MLSQFGTQAVFLSCGLTTLGLIFIVIGITGARSGRSSIRWPVVDGEILSSDPAFDPLSGRQQACVRYAYRVNEKSYTGTRVRLNDSRLFSAQSGDPAGAEIQRYPAGQVVPVYYDPKDPSRSVLVPGSGPLSMIPIGIGGLFFILGLVAGLFAFLPME